MTYQEALTYIHSHKRFGSRAGLERITALMGMLGDPQEKLRVVHVAGTNGKGSTCAMLASIFQAAGIKTGLTVSPYVLDFCERIQVDGEMIPREALAREIERIRPLAGRVPELTEFELVTAAAYDYFARRGCGIVVAETGLGGRFDATNVVRRPLCCVITAIGLDHTDILGGTIEEIAFEKAGIFKQGAIAVLSPGQDPKAREVLVRRALEAGVKRIVSQEADAVEGLRLSLEGAEFTLHGTRYRLPLAGGHQVDNALTAIRAALELLPPGAAASGAVARGLGRTRFPARMEVLCRDPLTVLDGAHNPQGAKALAGAMALLGGRPVTAVMGVLADKDSAGALEMLAPHFKRLICVTPDNPRALDGHELAARADALGLQASAAHSAREAWELASAVARAEHGAVVACGSLYLAAELRPIILEEQA